MFSTTPFVNLFIKKAERRRSFFHSSNRFPRDTNKHQHMFQSITKIKRPFLTDDLCVKVALQLNYVPVTQNIQISRQKTEQKYFNEHSLFIK